MRNRGSVPNMPLAQPVRDTRHDHAMDRDIDPRTSDASGSPVLERVIDFLKPGHTVRIPVGYFFLACASVLVLLVAIYMIGVSVGKSIQTADYRERLGEGFEISLQRGGVNDPLTNASVMDSRASELSAGPTRILGNESSSPRTAGGLSPGMSDEWGPVQPAVDPRQPGWNYFIAATNTAARCLSLAEFCRASGLETYVIPHKNGAQVIVFPGFQGSRQAPEVKALEQRIHQIGDKYKAANRYETNMRDAYPARYGG